MTSEAGDRAAFLDVVRRSIAVAPPFGHSRALAPVVGGTTAPVAYRDVADPDDIGGLVEGFSTALRALGGQVRLLATPDERAAFVADALTAVNANRVVLTAERECDGLRDLLDGHDVEVVSFSDPAAVAACDVGFTGARAAVALTGSIVVDSARAGGRTASLLPPLHVAFVRADAVVPTPGDLWRTLGSDLPSNLVQITGPSRSADIELIITLGVHGPKALWVGVLG